MSKFLRLWLNTIEYLAVADTVRFMRLGWWLSPQTQQLANERTAAFITNGIDRE